MGRLAFEQRVFLLALGAGAAGSVTALVLLWSGGYAPKVQWTLTVVIVLGWLGFAAAARERVVMPLQTLANLLEAMREGDYSIRAREPARGDVLGDLMIEVNQIGELLRSQRFARVDATALLQQVIEEIDVALFTFDAEGRLRLVNRAGERLLAQPSTRLLGRAASDLGLDDLLRDSEPVRTIERAFPGQTGRWQSRRSMFREGGAPTRLLVLSDLSKALRDEERQAWQRLIRVLGHELKNSLAPMKSTAATVSGLLRRDSPPELWRDDAQRGLDMIAERCESLNRFVSSYARLARLPAPRLRPTAIEPLVRRVAELETRYLVAVVDGPSADVAADAGQLEQLLINLVKNGVEAAQETEGEVEVSWRVDEEHVEITVADTGPGLAATQNLFVPFFTTKPGGSGIGLVLSRQIAEAHGGELRLENREDVAHGCVATLRLPRAVSEAPDVRDDGDRDRAPRDREMTEPPAAARRAG
ncbi:MAG: ATP-binding protein [Acidobacteriota bacterium]